MRVWIEDVYSGAQNDLFAKRSENGVPIYDENTGNGGWE